jgi:hypothetical protein
MIVHAHPEKVEHRKLTTISTTDMKCASFPILALHVHPYGINEPEHFSYV